MEPRSQVDDLVKLAFFTEVATSITGARTIKSALHAIMEHVGAIFAPRNWSLFLRDPKTGDLTFTVVTGSSADTLKGRTIPAGTGIVGWIAENGLPLIIEDVNRDSRFNPEIDSESGFSTRSIIGVPLITRGRVIGIIELINTLDERPFTPLDLKILHTIADLGAIAIERNYYEHALHRLSNVDPLTGAGNRRSWERTLEREKERARRTGKPFSILMIDIDRFKAINDSYGHPAGDEVLRSLARILEDCTRQMDSVARMGGDEFSVLLPDTPHDKAEEARTRILNIIGESAKTSSLPFSVSIGLETAGPDNLDSTVSRADRDMYARKQTMMEAGIMDIHDNIGGFLEEEFNQIG